MKKHIVLISFCLLLFSCNSNTIYTPPKDLISEEKMADVLTDLYIAKASKEIRNKEKRKNDDYRSMIFSKHKISTERFKKSLEYYTSLIKIHEEILKKVQINLESKLTEKNSLKSAE